ncbi:hypothetical protein AGMMS50239_05950 [Bacteroidia bacterium]|nr:hypothetical protein AGMMS50239_05950 [Bacteroidia bacterium]
MKVTLTKYIDLQGATVYLTFEKDTERLDIQKYLNGEHFDNEIIEKRVLDYLRSIGILDENYQPTSYGNFVKKTGLLKVREEGKYQIWLTQNDSFFGNKIFYFRRIQPNNDVVNEINIRIDNSEHFYLPTAQNKFAKLKLVHNDDYWGQKNQRQDRIMLHWIWQDTAQSAFRFEGKLGNNNTEIGKEYIPCQIDLDEKIQEILPNWDTQIKRYKIFFNETDEASRLSCEGNLDYKWNDFNVRIEKLPLMPYNAEDAKKWRDRLVIETLKKEYLTVPDFESVVIETNEKEAFQSYTNSLNIPKPQTFSDSIKKDTVAFWHLNAPMDLNPKTKVNLAAKPVELKEGDEISFAEIANKLGYDNSGNSAIFLYYDKYVVNHRQQKSVAALSNAFVSNKKIVVTDLTPKENSSDFISKQCSDIKLKEITTIFKTGYPAHDRYIVFGNSEKLNVWNIPNSIDFITFSDRNIDKNTVGTIRQSVVFTPISKEMLKPELLNFINSELQNGK